MIETNSINVFEKIQSICGEFRRQLKSGDCRGIEEYLDRVDESARSSLFQNLLHIDVEHRRERREDPSSEEYVSRFPLFSELIRQTFLEPTISQGMLADTVDHRPSPACEAPAARRLGEYQLQRELGRGGFGVVYEARHLQLDDLVALKTLPRRFERSGQLDEAERLHRFRNEFRALSQINHPNLVGMQALEVDGSQWFFTMDLVNGVDFLPYVRPKGRLDQTRLRTVLTQLASGIVALHRQGIVHCDLKPSNVLVEADGHVVILDFGLVFQLQHQSDRAASSHPPSFAGTPRYAAPEQVAGVRIAASDWYALGVMLYEALTGQAPFQETGMQLLLRKQREDAPRLSGQAGMPEDLTALADQLLQRQPDRRPDGQAVLQQLGVETEDSGSAATNRLAEPITETMLVGRESQLARLDGAFGELLDHREPVVVWIRGRSGEGKSSLVEKFLEPKRSDDRLLVLSGRCYDRESVPFKAIDCLIEDLVEFLRSRSKTEVSRLLPEDVHMLAHLFPVLRRIDAVAECSGESLQGIDGRQIRYRAFAALRKLLTTISRDTPVILFVDDLQWGDGDSAGALFEMLLPPLAPAVMWLGTYRTDEAAKSPFLGEWRQRNDQRRESTSEPKLRETEMEVLPLTDDQSAAVCAARLGVDTETVQEQAGELFQAAQGNPYFLEQLMEGFDVETGRFEAIPLGDIILRRLRRLPGEAAPLLETIAIAGQAVALDEAAGVSGQSGQTFATITRMRNEQLVRLVGAGDQQRVDTYHDKIREAILGELDASKRRQLHLHHGEYLEQREPISAEETLVQLGTDAAIDDMQPTCSERIFDLATHFHVAGDPRAFAYQLMAGERSYHAYASEDAVAFLRRAESSLPGDASDAIRYRLRERLATSRLRLKDFDGALAAYQLAIGTAPSNLARAKSFVGIANIDVTLGKFSSALANYDEALQQIGRRRPRFLKAMFKLGWIFTKIFCLPWPNRPKLDPVAEATNSLEQRACTNLSYFLYEKSIVDVLYSGFRSGELALRAADHSRFIMGMTVVGASCATMGWPSGGFRLLRWIESENEQVADPEIKGRTLIALAMMRVAARDLKTADQEFALAQTLLLKAGVHQYAFVCSHFQRHLRQVIGSAPEEIESAENTLSIADDLGDTRGKCWGHFDLACGLARRGNVEFAKSHLEQSRNYLSSLNTPVTESIFLAVEGYVLLQTSQYENARAPLEDSWRACRSSKVFMEFNLRCLPLLIESLAGPDWVMANPSDRKALEKVMRQTHLIDWMYPNILSPFQRARGRGYWILGKKKKAIRSFERAIKSAESLGAEYDRARSMIDLAAVKQEGAEKLRRESVEILKRQQSAIPYAERSLLGESLDEQCLASLPER